MGTHHCFEAGTAILLKSVKAPAPFSFTLKQNYSLFKQPA